MAESRKESPKLKKIRSSQDDENENVVVSINSIASILVNLQPVLVSGNKDVAMYGGNLFTIGSPPDSSSSEVISSHEINNLQSDEMSMEVAPVRFALYSVANRKLLGPKVKHFDLDRISKLVAQNPELHLKTAILCRGLNRELFDQCQAAAADSSAKRKKGIKVNTLVANGEAGLD